MDVFDALGSINQLAVQGHVLHELVEASQHPLLEGRSSERSRPPRLHSLRQPQLKEQEQVRCGEAHAQLRAPGQGEVLPGAGEGNTRTRESVHDEGGTLSQLLNQWHLFRAVRREKQVHPVILHLTLLFQELRSLPISVAILGSAAAPRGGLRGPVQPPAGGSACCSRVQAFPHKPTTGKAAGGPLESPGHRDLVVSLPLPFFSLKTLINYCAFY